MPNRANTLTMVIAIVACLLFAPLAAAAQQVEKGYRIGFLTAVSPIKAFQLRLAALRKGLRELGYVEGKNIVIEERFAKGRREQLPELAAELVRLKLDVILTHGDSIARIVNKAAKAAGRTVPIVLTVSSDPVRNGLVAGLAQPGGNITGVTSSSVELAQKRLALLKEIVPAASRIAVFWDSRVPPTVRQMKTLKDVAPTLGVKLIPIEFVKGHVDRAFDAVRRERSDALNVLAWGLSFPYTKRIADFAFKNRLPTVFASERFVVAGGMMSYGADFDGYRRAATYVHKILKGAKPAELPVEQPTRFKLTLNLKTAKALGITLPPSILLRATEVIE